MHFEYAVEKESFVFKCNRFNCFLLAVEIRKVKLY